MNATRPDSQSKTAKTAHRSGFGVACLLVAVHLAALLTILVEPQLLSTLNMQVNSFQASGGLWHTVTGIFGFSNNIAANVWTMLFVAAFSMETAVRIGRWQTVIFYLASGVFSCLLWGLGFVLTGEKVCITAPLQTSAAVTGLGALLVFRDPAAKLRLFSPLPVFAWAGLLVFLTISAQFFWWEKWSVLLPAHLAAATFAFLVDRVMSLSDISRSWLAPIESRAIALDEDFPTDFANPALDVGDASEPDVEVVSPPLTKDSDINNRLDEILEKITKLGSDSLTAEERNLLLKASDKLRKRRGI